MNNNNYLTVEDAYNMLSTVIMPEYKQALDTLYNQAKNNSKGVGNTDNSYITYKQYKFMRAMAEAANSTIANELEDRGITIGEKPWQINKSDGKRVIDEFIELGYRDLLQYHQSYINYIYNK